MDFRFKRKQPNFNTNLFTKLLLLLLLLAFSSAHAGDELSDEEQDAILHGCDLIEAESDTWNKLNSRIDTSLQTFFAKGKCDVSILDITPAPPFQLLLYRPSSIIGVASRFLVTFSKLDDKSLLPSILNKRDRNNRTMLDYHEQIFDNKSGISPALDNAMTKLRKRVCRYGGKYNLEKPPSGFQCEAKPEFTQ
jgi:hypothetical protein